MYVVRQPAGANSPKLALPRVKDRPRECSSFGQVTAALLINVVEKMITRYKVNKKTYFHTKWTPEY